MTEATQQARIKTTHAIHSAPPLQAIYNDLMAIATGRPLTRRNARIIAEYLREAGWRERPIGAVTAGLS